MILHAALLLTTLALAQAGTETPPAEPPPSAAEESPVPPKGAETDLLEESRRTAERLERIRGLRFTGVPPAIRAGEGARKEAASRRARAAVAAAALAARGRAWTDLGLAGEEAPRRLLEALASDLPGIGLDAEARRVLVDPSSLSANDFAPKEDDDSASSLLLATGVRPDEPALAHVLMHALQRGRTGADPIGGTTDGTLAASAWSEGEANLAAILFLFEGIGIQNQVIDHVDDPGEVLGGALLPASLDVLPGALGLFLDFVYREGYAQAAGAYVAGGWKAVDRAATGRRTSRDVLHPDRAPLVPASVPVPAPPEGWSLLDRDSLGEEGVVALVSTLTGKDNLGLMAGDGWAGDALFRFEPEQSPGGPDGLTVWATRWISPEEAADFEYGLERSLTARFPGAALVPVGSGGRRMAVGGKFLSLVRDGHDVVLRISTQPMPAPKAVPVPKSGPVRRKSNKSK